MMDHENDSVSMKELQRSNSVDGEIYVDAPSTLYTTMYINHGFDCDKEELANFPKSNVNSQSAASSTAATTTSSSTATNNINSNANVNASSTEFTRQSSTSIKISNNKNVTFGSTVIPINNNTKKRKTEWKPN